MSYYRPRLPKAFTEWIGRTGIFARPTLQLPGTTILANGYVDTKKHYTDTPQSGVWPWRLPLMDHLRPM